MVPDESQQALLSLPPVLYVLYIWQKYSCAMQVLMSRREAVELSRSLMQHKRRRAGPSLSRKRKERMMSPCTGNTLLKQ